MMRKLENAIWSGLGTVALRAEDAYPIGSVYWILIGTDETGCVVPCEAEGSEALLEALQNRLPGFDSEAVIEIMGLLECGREVWRCNRRGDTAQPGGHSPET